MIVGKNFEYDYPHDIVSINDLSFYNSAPASNNSATLLMPFCSDSGRDGNLLDIRNLSALFTEFGRPNFKRHGQPYYNVVKTLENGGRVYGMRITATDATYSNMYVSVLLKVAEVQRVDKDSNPLFIGPDGEFTIDDNSGANTAAMHKKATVKVVSDTKPLLKTDTKASLLADMKAAVEKVEGDYKKYPLFAVISKGKGVYGNNMNIRLNPKEDANERTEVSNYNIEIIKSQSGESMIDGPYHISFDEDARYDELSVYADKIVGKYGTFADVVTCDDGYDTMLEALQEVAAENAIDPAKIEVLINNPATNVDYVEFVTSDDDDIVLNSATGVKLESGSDGAWSGRFDFDGATRSDMATQYGKFYTGELDKTVLNTNKILPNYALDAGMPSSVKSAMSTLAAKRIDMVAILDCGMKNTVAEVLTFKESQTIDSRYTAFVSQHYMTYDGYTDKEVAVTATHQYAVKLPNHFALGRKNRPLAGLTYGKCSGIVSGTLKPNPDDPKDFGELNKAKLNWITEVDGKLIINNQVTSQSGMSALSELNNVMMLCEITSKIMRTVPLYRWEFSTGGDIKKFIDMGNEALRSYKSKLFYLKYRITQTPYEKERNILRSFIDIQFNPLVKKNVVEINVFPITAALK